MTATPVPSATTVDTTTDDALGTDDATALLQRLARRDVSAAELREAALARARAANPQLNAVVHWVDPARGADPPADPDAPLGGLPTVLKDNERLAGYTAFQGSLAVADHPARRSGPWAEQYLALGVQPLATTTLPEFGLTASTESSRHGATRNPWSTGHSVGGSSGGSAALVAAGAVPIAHANDGGGSIRIPAACSGLVGLKPSSGRLVDEPLRDRLPVNLAVQGVLTRTVRDTALYYWAAERAYRNPDLPPIGRVEGPSSQRLRVGLVTATPHGVVVEPQTLAAVERTGELLASLGHHVEPVAPPVDAQFASDFLRYWGFLSFLLERGGGRLFGPGFDARRVEVFTQGMAGYLVEQLPRLGGSLARLRRMARQHDGLPAGLDVVLSPVLAHPPPPIGWLGPDVAFRTHLVRLLRWTTFTPVQNISGAPAVSLPAGSTDDGLPLAAHLVAPYGQERRLLELAFELEAAAPWPLTPHASTVQ